MSCAQSIQDYALRSLGIGERLLPRNDFTLCEQVVLIGSGLIWNVYFGVLALSFGFLLATAVALGKAADSPWLRKPSEWFIFVFRGSPLFIQFFLAYEAFVLLPRNGIEILGITAETGWLTRAWAGALIVLFLNTAAYSGEIFYGALRSVPKGDLEAADAYGFTGWHKFRKITWPTMLRLAWPAYTNEAIFLFHATTLVYFSGFPAWQQKGDALYYANYFADKTFNPFVPYPIVAVYFILLTLCLKPSLISVIVFILKKVIYTGNNLKVSIFFDKHGNLPFALITFNHSNSDLNKGLEGFRKLKGVYKFEEKNNEYFMTPENLTLEN